jgi:hypothetical protein
MGLLLNILSVILLFSLLRLFPVWVEESYTSNSRRLGSRVNFLVLFGSEALEVSCGYPKIITP